MTAFRPRILPFLGLGLSSNAQNTDSPHPYRLLEAMPKAFDFLEYSAPLSVAQARDEASLFSQMLEHRPHVPLLYHPVHLNLWGPQVESAERMGLLNEHLETVGSPWVSNDVGWWHHEGHALPGYLYLTPPLDLAGLNNAVMHAKVVSAQLHVPLLLENPVVMTARGSMHVLEFMHRLSDETGCHLLLDVGHLFSHQLTRGLGLTEGLDGFPFERVTEMHIAGGVVTVRGNRRVYVDDHPQPIRDEVWSLLEWLLPKCTQLKALTYEGDGHPISVAKQSLVRLRHLMAPAAQAERTEVAPRQAHRVGSNEEGRENPFRLSSSEPELVGSLPVEAWQLFDEVHRGHCAADGPGAEAELDYRLAVIAQHLDATVPLTRLATAPSRTALAEFVASTDFREWFTEGLRELPDTFVTWALRAARAPGLEGAEALISLEAWARQLGRRLAPGATQNANFSMCLSEALHATRALTRHLSARAAWSQAPFEASGLAGVLQAAKRATPGPWPVTLRRVGTRVEVHEPPPG